MPCQTTWMRLCLPVMRICRWNCGMGGADRNKARICAALWRTSLVSVKYSPIMTSTHSIIISSPPPTHSLTSYPLWRDLGLQLNNCRCRLSLYAAAKTFPSPIPRCPSVRAWYYRAVRFVPREPDVIRNASVWICIQTARTVSATFWADDPARRDVRLGAHWWS